jgi:hypothetical protein
MAKSKPIGVRFDLYKLDMIQKEQNLTSVQQVVNYFLDGYKSISVSGTLLEIINTDGEPNILGKSKVKRGAPFKNMPPYDTDTPKLEVSSKLEQIHVEAKKTPPNGLKGIDLVIWKSENWK